MRTSDFVADMLEHNRVDDQQVPIADLEKITSTLTLKFNNMLEQKLSELRADLIRDAPSVDTTDQTSQEEQTEELEN